MAIPARTHKRRPHVHTQRVALTTSSSSPTVTTVTTKWEPHALMMIAISNDDDGGVLGVAGKNSGGTVIQAVGGIDGNGAGGTYSTNSYFAIRDGANGWNGAITFNSRGYVITWTVNGSKINATIEIVSVRGVKCEYFTDSRTAADSTGSQDYSTTGGWDPDIVLCYSTHSVSGMHNVGFSSDAPNNKSVNIVVSGSTGDNFEGGYRSTTFDNRRWSSGWVGWVGQCVVGSGKFTCTWSKRAGGETVTAHFWALKFQDAVCDEVTGTVKTQDIITGAGFTPLACFSMGRHNNAEGGTGVKTQSSELSVNSYGYRDWFAYSGDCARHGSNSSNYKKVNQTLSSGKVVETVSTTGTPSAESIPGRTSIAFGENGGVGGVA